MKNKKTTDYQMLETILYRSGELVLLEEHISRVRSSQLFFYYTWNPESVDKVIKEVTDALHRVSAKFAKVRLLVSHDGSAVTESTILESDDWGTSCARFKVSGDRTKSDDIFLSHKTTNRNFYNSHYRTAVGEGLDEVLFMNERDEIAEGAISNIFIKKNEKWLTPPVKCGLLPGVWRKKLIKELNAVEKILCFDDLKSAKKIILCNSLRGAVEAKFSGVPACR